MNIANEIERARSALDYADGVLAAVMAEAEGRERPERDGREGEEQPWALSGGFAAAVQLLRASGTRAFALGDTLVTGHALGGLMWTVIGADRDPAQGCESTLTLMNTEIAMGGAFDGPTLEHPWGGNGWGAADAREYLNHAFLEGFCAADRRVIQGTRRPTWSPAEKESLWLTDRVFLLSASEAGFPVDESEVMDEGAAYPYFAEDGPARRTLTDRKGVGRYWWLRSAHPYIRGNAMSVYPSGNLYTMSHAIYGNGFAPVVVIGG